MVRLYWSSGYMLIVLKAVYGAATQDSVNLGAGHVRL